MATRKRNEWLDPDESDEEEHTHESEDESRSRLLKSTKRRKVTHTPESDSEDAADNDPNSDDNNNAMNDGEADISTSTSNPHPLDTPAAELARLETLASTLPTDLKLHSGPLPAPSAPKKDKSGVIYLSRVPPFMKPTVLRTLLTPYGPVNRIFLTPEPTSARHQRLRTGGTRRKLYLDGWVEFVSKKDAKFVAEHLNAQTMGGKKRSRWHDEVWNVKYLSGVKWAHLVEQIQNENAERVARLRVEIAKGKKENARFLENVERGKMIEGIASKRREKGQVVDGRDEEVEVEGEGEQGGEQPKPKKERRSHFKQKEMRTKADKKPEPGQDVQRVLESIF